MTTRLSKQQLLDELKNAGMEIPANASSARLREIYESAIIGTACKDAEDASAMLNVNNAAAATVLLSLEDTAAKIKSDVKPNSDAKSKVDAKSDADAKSEDKLKSEVKSDVDVTTAVSQSNASGVDASAQNVGDEAADLDYQLQILRKKHEVLKLQHAIAALENGESEVPRVSTQISATNRLTFRDIEHAIVKFDGENRSYSVYDFLRNFERIMHMVAAEELFKYTSLCNSLSGTAKLLLNKTDVISYAQLKAALIKEFGRAINRSEIYKVLANYKWNKKDNIRRYVLEMENIASRCGDIDEFELIGFILDGMQDSTPDAYLLMNARTMNQFKESLDLYEQRRANRPFIIRDAAPPKQRIVPTKAVDTNAASANMTEIRCFNCTQMGHYQSKCPYDKRPNGSCFRCWQMGHDHRSCTNPKKLLTIRKKEVAAVYSDETDVNHDFYENAIYAVNNSN